MAKDTEQHGPDDDLESALNEISLEGDSEDGDFGAGIDGEPGNSGHEGPDGGMDAPGADQISSENRGPGEPEGDETDGDDRSELSDEQIGLAESLRNIGFEGDLDEENAPGRLLAAYEQQLHQSRAYQEEMAELRKRLEMTHDPEYLRYLAHRQAQEEASRQAQEEPEPATPWWNPPKMPDPKQVQKYLLTNQETGEVSWSPNTPMELRAQVEAAQNYQDEWANDLLNRPHEALQKPFEQFFASKIQELQQNPDSALARAVQSLAGYTLDSRVYERQNQEFTRQVVLQNEDWLYERDPRTQQIAVNPRTGNRIFSEEGRRASQYVSDAADLGITSAQDQWRYAISMIDRDRAIVAATPARNGRSDKSKRQFLDQAAQRSRPRGASVPDNHRKGSELQDEDLDPGRSLVNELIRQNAFTS